jgi:glutathione S-transferase
MKLYYSPGACSLGIHVLLEEIGKPYELVLANLRLPPPERDLTAINPKSKVPTLVRDDGSVLTEYPAIAWWLAAGSPQAKLFPADAEGQARTLEALDYFVATVHMQGFFRLFSAGRLKTPEEQEGQRTLGAEIANRGFARAEALLDGKDWLAGTYSAADTALFYVSNWAGNFGITLPPRVAAHFARMKARPAVASALKQEGLS